MKENEIISDTKTDAMNAAENTTPEEVKPEETTPAETTPEEPKPDEKTPEDAVPAEEQPEEAAPEKKKITRKELIGEILEIAETMLVSVFIVLLAFTYLMRPVTVDGRSMVPTLNHEDKLVMYRLFYQPQQGDIVVVNNHEGHVFDANGDVVPSGRSLNENIIKRVIALPGQEVKIDVNEGEVYVDGEPLRENYINERTMTNDGAFIYPITVPKGYVFVMGDNRNNSTDSRSASVGLVAIEDILGKAYFRYYPYTHIGIVK